MNKKLFLMVFGLFLSVLALAASSLASPPNNDNFANAIAINSLPFSDTVDNTSATTEVNEPIYGCYDYSWNTVWYAITPATNGVLRADMGGSNFYDIMLRVYQQNGSDIGSLLLLGCASPNWNGATSVTFSVSAGTTYYIQAGDIYSGGGSLDLTVEEVLPPANDNFADATVITEVPFSDPLDLAAATVETGEDAVSCFFAPVGTAWYAFTPSVTQSYVGNLTSDTGLSFYVGYGIYTGSLLGNLSQVVCKYWNPVVFHATAGMTYYIQVVNRQGQANLTQFTLDVAPPPQAYFYFDPYEPSVFDTIEFYDASYDPAGGSFQSWSWQFGDGATATDYYTTHQFAADGDYTVQLTVTTEDGRTASNSQVVSVRTHDVAITKFVVPTSATTGQTRTITVGINSKRYPETVEVQLFKSSPTGYQSVGTLRQSVPVRPANRTTNFNFSYTFTRSDAKMGKVTFKAVASIINAYDALWTDNEAISLPTKVTR